MTLLRIGYVVLNMDQVTDIEERRDAIIVYFAGGRLRAFEFEEADRLRAWLDEHAPRAEATA